MNEDIKKHFEEGYNFLLSKYKVEHLFRMSDIDEISYGILTELTKVKELKLKDFNQCKAESFEEFYKGIEHLNQVTDGRFFKMIQIHI